MIGDVLVEAQADGQRRLELTQLLQVLVSRKAIPHATAVPTRSILLRKAPPQ